MKSRPVSRPLFVYAVLLAVASSTIMANVLFPNQVYNVGRSPRDIALADLNLDGYLDMVVCNQRWDSVSVFMRQEDGSFAPRPGFATRPSPTGVGGASQVAGRRAMRDRDD